MTVSEYTLTWLMRLYPPLFFQRIWVRKIHRGFRGADVKINRSLFTTNFGRSIFGGTIFAATDPFYALLFGQILQRKGFRLTVWLKSAEIHYLKPGRTDLYYTIRITDEMIEEAVSSLKKEGKFVRAYPVEIYDRSGELCATVLNEVYVRDLNFVKPPPDPSG
jgi:acyl-coenzyme A thioesterase PaaI-like protein